MHLDIKSDNLLVSEKGTITLIDFGNWFVGDHLFIVKVPIKLYPNSVHIGT